MRKLVSLLALTVVVALPCAAPAADAQDKPSVIIRFRSLDTLISEGKYIATLTGHEELAKQFEGFVKNQKGPKGLEGVDTKKPIGFAGIIGPQGIDSTGIVLVPIADQKAFLDFLERLNYAAEKEDEVAEDAIRPFEEEEQLLLSRALRATKGNVRRDQWVLVNAAGSGVGIAAIQVAKLMGAIPIKPTPKSTRKAIETAR